MLVCDLVKRGKRILFSLIITSAYEKKTCDVLFLLQRYLAMANNEAGETRVDDAQASKLSVVSIFAYFKIRENSMSILLSLYLFAEFASCFRMAEYIIMEYI